MLACRITYMVYDVSTALQKIADKSEKLVVYAHDDGNRPHIHFLIEGITQSTDTIKNWIKKDVGTVAKTDWSFKTEHEGKPIDYGYVTYMSKGKLDPVFNKGFTDSELIELRNKWVVHKPSSKKWDLKDARVDKEKTQKEIVEVVIRELNGSSNPREIVKILNRILSEEQKIVGRYKFRDYVDTILSRVDKTGWEEQMLNFCRFPI